MIMIGLKVTPNREYYDTYRDYLTIVRAGIKEIRLLDCKGTRVEG